MGTVDGVSRSFSDAELKLFAQEHIAYEFEALADAVTLMKTATDDRVRRSMLETSLGHVRVLDDFFRRPVVRAQQLCPTCKSPLPDNTKDDVMAQHYLSDWEPKSILTGKVRDLLNGQMPHLAMRRGHGVEWEVGPLAVKAGDLVTSLVDDLSTVNEDRAAWFDAASKHAARLVQEPARLGILTMPKQDTSSTSTLTMTMNRPACESES
jgi:hypothetical protein